MRYLMTVVLALAACGGGAPPTPEPVAAPAFDVAAVRATFTDDCVEQYVVDDLFCEQVEVAGMTGEDDILYVPTTLNPEADERADAICQLIAFAHFDTDGNDLGYRYVGILDMNRDNLAACSVD